MEDFRIKVLYTEWQRFVREHACMLRDARMSGIKPEELNELSAAYVLRIDAAYSRFTREEQGTFGAAA